MAVSLFVNPAAARGRAGRCILPIQRLFGDAGIDCPVFTSTRTGDIEAAVASRLDAGDRRIVVAGGDGSVHEAANAILNGHRDAALGVIPIGTGNDFAKAVSVPLDWRRAAGELIARIRDDRPHRSIDVIRVNDRHAVNGAGIGLDARVTRIAQARRWRIGSLVYLAAVFEAMLDGVASPSVDIEADGFEWHGPVTLVALSNGPYIGGIFRIAPTADNADGRLELLVAAPVTRRRILALLPKLVRGRHLREKDMRHASVQRLRITAAEPLPSHLDGEVQPLETNFDVQLLSAVLKLA